jgi:P27 family predicted phage terminase small subunit
MPDELRSAPEVVVNALAVRGLPQAPEYLSDAAKETFRKIVDELEPRGLRDADLEAVAMLCHSASVHQEATRLIATQGLIVKGPRGPMVNPLVKVARDEAANYLRLADAFGLTLGSRLRLGLMQLTGESILASLNRELDV